MIVHIPAMCGKIGSRTYYACLMPLNAIPNLFKFTDWAGFTPEDREQRVLNEKRVPDLKNYILDNEDDYIFASITASYKSPVDFVPAGNIDASGGEIGVLKLKLGDELIINDGQHRCAGIAEAVKANPAIGDHTISVLLFPWESTERVQQMFSDLNRFVQKTSKSLDILYDKRDQFSAATLAALEKVPLMNALTDKDNVSLKAKSPKLFTLAALYDANRELLKGRESMPIMENAQALAEFWETVCDNMADWQEVYSGRQIAGEMRAARISSHSTVLRALGGLGQELLSAEGQASRLRLLREIDWSKKNPDWEGVCIVANSVISNRQARAATKAYIKDKLGVPMSDAERRMLVNIRGNQ